MSQSLLVYDGRAEPFRAAVGALVDGSADLRALPWESEPAQAFLEAQFGSRPFAVVLIEGDSVHVGEAAIGRLLRKGGVAGPVAALLESAYPRAAGPFGRVFHGRAPADLHGTFALEADARAHVEPFRRSRDVPVREA